MGQAREALVYLGNYASTHYPCEVDAFEDMRRATYVLGTQGSGKSTLLGNLVEQFAGAGEGVLLVPHIARIRLALRHIRTSSRRHARGVYDRQPEVPNTL